MGLLQQQGYTSLGGKGATSGGGGLLQQQGFTSLAEASKPSVTVTKKVTTTAPVQKSTVSTPLEGARKALEAFGSNVQKAAQSAQKTIGGLTVKLTAPSKQQEQIQQKAQALPKTLIIKPGQTKIDPIQLKQAGLSATLTPQAQQQARETPSKIVNDLNTLNQKAGPLIYNQENLMSSAGLASEQQKSAMAENPKLKLTATALLAGFIEDSMNALLPMSGGTVGVGRNILKEGPNIVAGAKGALVASGLTALVSKMKGEDLDMQSLLINGGIGAVIGASEPHVSVGGKKIDLLGAEKTLKDFGFSKADLSNPTSLKAKFNEYVKANHPDVLGGKGGESFAEFNNAYSKEYAKTVEAFNKMTSAGIDPSWSLKDVQLWIKNLWRGKKTPEQLAQAVESSKTKLTDLAEAKQGKPTIDTIIPPGEHTPQQVIGKVVSSGLEKTTAGKELVKTALEAQKTGQNIVIEAPVTAPSKEVATETPSDVATTLRQAKGLSAEEFVKANMKSQDVFFKDNSGMGRTGASYKTDSGRYVIEKLPNNQYRAFLYDTGEPILTGKTMDVVKNNLSKIETKLNTSNTNQAIPFLNKEMNTTPFDEAVLKHPNSFKERSQLTDLYNKATKPVAKPVDVVELQKKMTEEQAKLNPVAETKVVEKPVQEVSVPKETVKPKDDEFISRVYKRAMEENPDLDAAGGMTKKVNLKEESEKAVKLMEEDRQKAFRVAMNAEDSPGVLNNLVNVALREKALEEGNKGLYQTLLKNASFAQTRRGQEIASEKADIANNSTSRYVKELLNARLEILGDKFTMNIKEKLTASRKKRGLNAIDEQVKAQKKSFVDRKMDMQRAQALIDSLICK